MEQNLFLSKMIGVVVAFVVLAVVLVPICDSLTDSNGGGGGSGNGSAVGSAAGPLTYTNEGDYYYQDYDKATADAMAISMSLSSGSDVGMNINIGGYVINTPTYPATWTSEVGDPNKCQIIIPLFEIRQIPGDFNGIMMYLNGHYDLPGPTYTFDLCFLVTGTSGGTPMAVSMGMPLTNEILAGVTSVNTLLGLLPFFPPGTPVTISYDTIRLLASEGDHVSAKNPVVGNESDAWLFNAVYDYIWDENQIDSIYKYYVWWVDGVETHTEISYNGGSGYSQYGSDPTIVVNRSTIDDLSRIDSFTVQYVGTSSNGRAYLEYADVYAIVPKTVEYTLASGNNTNNVTAHATYYETAPNLNIAVSYTTEIREAVIWGEDDTVTSVDTLTLSYDGHSITIDNRANLNEYFTRMASATSSDEWREIDDWMYSVNSVPILFNPPVNNETSSLRDRILEIVLPYAMSQAYVEDGLSDVPTSISVTPTQVTVTLPNNSWDYSISGPSYIISDTGDYGVFSQNNLSEGVYVGSDILTDFNGPITGQDSDLGFSQIFNMNFSSSVYETTPRLQDTYALTIEDGMLKGIGWNGGYRQTGNNPMSQYGYISAQYVILPLSADGGSGGDSSDDDGDDLGTTGTLIRTIPIFVALGLIVGIVGLFYQNRKTI